MSKKREMLGTHCAVDPDAVTSIFLLEEYGDSEKMKNAKHFFLKGGDENLNSFPGITLVDRGRGPLDHHGRLGSKETSASLIAKKLGIENNREIWPLLEIIRRNDLQGILLPFDVTDIIKCCQRNKELNDEEKLEIGLRIVRDTVEFGKKNFQRYNHYAQEIIVDFLVGKRAPKKFLDYLRKTKNIQFERPFDFVEILVVERILRGEREAVRFARKLLEIVHRDASIFHEAKEEFRNAMAIEVNNQVIIAVVSDNPKFNTAARAEGATIIIQRTNDGHNQIYFNTEKVDETIVQSMISMIRLEECLVQRRTIPDQDLRWSGRVEGIPEWYYYEAPVIGKKKPGRFILNGSLTAPDVPRSKILLGTLFHIAQCAVRYRRFNWKWWKAERVAWHQKQKGKRNA